MTLRTHSLTWMSMRRRDLGWMLTGLSMPVEVRVRMRSKNQTRAKARKTKTTIVSRRVVTDAESRHTYACVGIHPQRLNCTCRGSGRDTLVLSRG